jgi:hypothetical protein
MHITQLKSKKLFIATEQSGRNDEYRKFIESIQLPGDENLEIPTGATFRKINDALRSFIRHDVDTKVFLKRNLHGNHNMYYSFLHSIEYRLVEKFDRAVHNLRGIVYDYYQNCDFPDRNHKFDTSELLAASNGFTRDNKFILINCVLPSIISGSKELSLKVRYEEFGYRVQKSN